MGGWGVGRRCYYYWIYMQSAACSVYAAFLETPQRILSRNCRCSRGLANSSNGLSLNTALKIKILKNLPKRALLANSEGFPGPFHLLRVIPALFTEVPNTIHSHSRCSTATDGLELSSHFVCILSSLQRTKSSSLLRIISRH